MKTKLLSLMAVLTLVATSCIKPKPVCQPLQELFEYFPKANETLVYVDDEGDTMRFKTQHDPLWYSFWDYSYRPKCEDYCSQCDYINLKTNERYYLHFYVSSDYGTYDMTTEPFTGKVILSGFDCCSSLGYVTFDTDGNMVENPLPDTIVLCNSDGWDFDTIVVVKGVGLASYCYTKHYDTIPWDRDSKNRFKSKLIYIENLRTVI